MKLPMRHGSAALWASVNPILKTAEIGVEDDTLFYKTGDGITLWNDLPYFHEIIPSGPPGPPGPQGIQGIQGPQVIMVKMERMGRMERMALLEKKVTQAILVPKDCKVYRVFRVM